MNPEGPTAKPTSQAGQAGQAGPPAQAPSSAGWFRSATVRLPTLRTWFLFAGVAASLAWLGASKLPSYLAPNAPLPHARVLVLDAAPTPEAAALVAALIRSEHYSRLIAVGMPIDPLSPLNVFTTGGDLWAARLRRAGVASSLVEVVRVPAFQRQRTAHKSLAVARHLALHPTATANLLTDAAHGRRSLLTYREALAPTRLGVLSTQPSFDLAHFWTSSAGMRNVIGETIALSYYFLAGDEVEEARAHWDGLDEAERRVPERATSETPPLPAKLFQGSAQSQ